MRLSSRFRITYALSFGSIVVLGLIVAWATYEARRAHDAEAVAGEIRDLILERAIVRDEFFLYREARARAQFETATARLDSKLSAARTVFASVEAQRTLDEMQNVTAASKAVFEEFARLPDGREALSAPVSAATALSQRLASRLILIALDLDGNAGRLRALAAERSRVTEVRTTLLVISLIVLTLALASVNAAMATRLVKRRIERLQAGAERIAAGDFAHRIDVKGDDELAALGRSFDAMAARVEASHSGLAAEVAERARAEEAARTSEERFRGAVDASLDAYFLLRAVRDDTDTITDFEFVHANRNAASIVAVPAESLPGQRLCEILPVNRTGGFLAKYARVVETRTALEEEFAIEAPGVKPTWIHHQVVPVGDGVAINSRDVTDRKHSEEAIRTLNASLETRADELEAANKELEAFSYSVSHDLRAPLRAVDGFSRILLEDHGDQLDAEGKRLLGVVRTNTVRMGQLIDDLLAFSRVGRTTMTRSSVDMESLARASFEEARTAGDAVSFRVGPLPPAEGDPSLLRQVWGNLISNAVKFTGPKPERVVEVEGRTEEGRLVYSVKDNGVGFDAAYSNKLFGVFQRLHSSAEFEGTGVGLALVQRIVHREGGEVWAEGKVGEGATFSFSLPCPGGSS
ncbi:MAG: ATP-binding protein [Acidobacteriota bacterium]